MVVIESIQVWQNMKLKFFMRLSKTRMVTLKKLSGSLLQGARPNLRLLSTATEMIMATLLARFFLNSGFKDYNLVWIKHFTNKYKLYMSVLFSITNFVFAETVE